MLKLAKHHLRIKGQDAQFVDPPDAEQQGESVRGWLTALAGAEHLSLLIGSGLGLGVAGAAGLAGLSMDPVTFSAPHASEVEEHATTTAATSGRGTPNIEDYLRSALQLLAGLEVLGDTDADQWRTAINDALTEFAEAALSMESSIRGAFEDPSKPGGQLARRLLTNLLLAFASRPPSRERTSVFTTNYDRLLEYGADLAGLRVVDRFVGSVEPIFRASRLDVDLHYNPPGIRGEPRYLDGVIRLYKLHGSLDWRYENGQLRRIPLSVGGADPDLSADALRRLMIYPNAAKDVETLEFPYAEIFRDLAAAICRPNGVLVTLGYGFGDDHINRVIRDMLTLSSTHLLVIAYGDPGDRIAKFLSDVPPLQCSLLYGPHFADLETLVQHYLPNPGSDEIMRRVPTAVA